MNRMLNLLQSRSKNRDRSASRQSRPAVEILDRRELLTASPYVIPVNPTWITQSILTVGDAVGNNNYRMAGIPDGLGAFDNGDGTFTLLMNQEIGNTLGVTRDHGAKGAFVSKWIINKSDLSVVSGSDLIKNVYLWDTTNQAPQSTTTAFAFNRFCSADLPAVSAFYNTATGLGTQERIFMNGEEGGSTGYPLANVVTGSEAGNTYVLGKMNPSLNGSGLTAVGGWENLLANPYAQDKTVVIGNNDGGTGVLTNALAVYVGTKTNSGTPVDRAGLNNGVTKFINVTGNSAEVVNTTTRATNITNGTRFTLSTSASTTFSRPEDGAWNPADPKQYYFVTTDRLDQVSDGLGTQVGQTRLWRLTFDDITNPDAGGKIDLLIDGRTVGGQKVNMFDNITVNEKTGHLILLEDVGGAAHNGKVWDYDPASDTLVQIAKHDPARFGDVSTAPTSPFNNDEETSGVIDVQSILGAGSYLLVNQAHYNINSTTPNGFTNPDQLVEGGQLLLLKQRVADSTQTGVSFGTKSALVSSRINDLPWGNISKFSLTFNTADVNSVNDLTVTGRNGKSYPVASVSTAGNTVTWTLTAPITDPDVVTLTVNPQKVNYTKTVRILPGDVNDDGMVTSADVVAMNNAIASAYNLFADINGDGLVNSTDMTVVRKRIGSKL